MRKWIVIGLAIFIIISAVVIVLSKYPRKIEDLVFIDENIEIETREKSKLTFYLGGLLSGSGANVKEEIAREIEKRTVTELNISLDIGDGLNSLSLGLQRFTGRNYFYGFSAGICLADTRDDNLAMLARDGLIQDISELFPKNAPQYYKKLNGDELASVTVDEKIFAVPNYFPVPNRRCVMIREDMAKKYNVSDINSFEELEIFMQKVKENEPDVFPLFISGNLLDLFAAPCGYVIFDYNLGLVYNWDDPEMELIPFEQIPEFQYIVDTISRWCSEGYIIKGANFLPSNDGIVTSGKFAAIIDAPGSSATFNLMLVNKGLVDWRYKEYRLYPGKTVQKRGVTGAAIVFPSGANPDEIGRILEFIEWLHSSQDNYDLFMYGIRGRHYTLYGEQLEFPPNTSAVLSYMLWPGLKAFKNIDYERTNIACPPDYKQKLVYDMEEGARYAPHTGFYPDIKPILNYVNARGNSLYRLLNTIQQGSQSSNRIKDMIEWERSKGVDSLIVEMQRQLDEWRRK